MDAETERRLHDQADQRARARILGMTPGERMEEAFRLFWVIRGK